MQVAAFFWAIVATLYFVGVLPQSVAVAIMLLWMIGNAIVTYFTAKKNLDDPPLRRSDLKKAR